LQVLLVLLPIKINAQCLALVKSGLFTVAAFLIWVSDPFLSKINTLPDILLI
jgi:hypothetical protein